MTANTSLAKGRDPRYLTEGAGTGHAGGTRYYSEAAGEPPGQWGGRRRPASTSGGTWTRTSSRRSTWTAWRRTASALTRGPALTSGRSGSARRRPWPLTWWRTRTPRTGELEPVRAAERAKSQSAVPYFDFTVSAAKSV